jgi:AcrR family transcriptional regulator
MTEKRSRGEVRNDKLQKVAANLFLKKGYEGVTVDQIVAVAGGSKSTVYSEFGGKCGLFISSIAKLCREFNEPLSAIDYSGLTLEQSVKTLAFHILKQITAKRSVELHRLVIGEAANCPELGEAWYIHGPARTISIVRALLEKYPRELRHASVPIKRMAVIFHDSLTGDILDRLLAGVSKPYDDKELQHVASDVVNIVFGNLRK